MHDFTSVISEQEIRELKQRLRRKTIGLMRKQKTAIALLVRFKFWYISLPSNAKQQHEVTKVIQGFVENVSTRR